MRGEGATDCSGCGSLAGLVAVAASWVERPLAGSASGRVSASVPAGPAPPRPR